LGCRSLDSGVDVDPILHHRADDSTGELAGCAVGLDLGQVAFEDRRRGALPEIRFEDRRQRDTAPGAERPDPVSPVLPTRHHALTGCRDRSARDVLEAFATIGGVSRPRRRPGR